MRELPILFKPEMHRAIREKRKTQTRRLIKGSKRQDWLTSDVLSKVARMKYSKDGWWSMAVGEYSQIVHCGYTMDGGHIGSVRSKYQVGDRLWVREALVMSASRIWLYQLQEPDAKVIVMPAAADLTAMLTWAHHKDGNYCNPLHMPKWAARTWLEVREVRAQRVQDISEEDAIAEGVTPFPFNPEGDCWTDGKYKTAFNYIWGEINGWTGPHTWEANPWVWAYTFDVISL